MNELKKCPVCDGRGFVKGNFYDVAGQTCSFGDYMKKEQSTVICAYCNGHGVVNIEYKRESKGGDKMKEYQIELKVRGEGGIYPYVVSSMKEEWAKQDAIQMLLRDFPIFNGKEITTYKIICLEPKTRQTVFRQTEDEFEQLKNDAYEHKMNISDYLRYLVAKERKEREK